MCIQCCKCRKIVVSGEWKEPPARLPTEISHTYCPSCLDASLTALHYAKLAMAESD